MKEALKTAVFAILGLMLLFVGISAVSAQDGGAIDGATSAEFIPETAGDFDQSSIANAGDVNGDGYDDILIGAGIHNNNTGVAYLILGRPDGWSLGKYLVHQSIIKYSGEATNHWAGSSVAGAGDVNGDGYDDILVGAYGNNTAYLILGSPAPASSNLSTAIKYSGEQAGHQAGSSVAGAGDVNGDGYDDFVVGAQGSGNLGSGGVYLVLGSATPTSANLSTAVRYGGEGIGDEAGKAVAGAGDVNGDGYDDVLVGVSKNDAFTGAAYVILGSANPAGGNLSTAVKYSGETAGDEAGTSVAGVGDVNGDGYEDVFIGAPNHNSTAGAAYLVLGSPSPTSHPLISFYAIKYDGEVGFDEAGTSVAGVGDVNGDGYQDMLAGAPYNRSFLGAAYLILGSSEPTPANLGDTIKYSGGFNGTGFGASVGGGGDVNGDGYTDMLFIADNANNIGSAYLLFSDAFASGAEPYRHRTRLAGGGNALAVTLDQSRVKIDFTGSALTGADVAVTRHIVHPCYNNLHLEMPIWDVESAKLGSGTTFDMAFEYTDAQIGDMVESNFKLYWRPIGKHCSAWTEVPNNSVNPAINQVTATGQSMLGQFTIADALPPPTSVGVSQFNNTSGQGPSGSITLGLIVMMGAGGSMALWRYRQDRSI